MFNVADTPESTQRRIRQNYYDAGQRYVPLHRVLYNVSVPKEATHLLVEFRHQQKWFKIPYSLQHQVDAFPCEHERYLEDPDPSSQVEKISLVSSSETHDVTEVMLPMSRRLFACGFAKFRPYAWTWLHEGHEHKDASLVASRPGFISIWRVGSTTEQPEWWAWPLPEQENENLNT